MGKKSEKNQDDIDTKSFKDDDDEEEDGDVEEGDDNEGDGNDKGTW